MRNKAKKMLSCVLALALAVSMNSVSGVILPGTHAVLADEVVQGTPYALVDGELKYDVTVDHVIINQVFGANKSSSTSHGFIELYNPTNKDVDLSNWSVQYKSSEEGGDNEEWLKCDLEGTIKAHSSYLIRGREHNPDTPDLWVAEGDIEWDIKMHTKGLSVVLLSNQELLDAEAMPFNNETKAPNVDGYVDMIGVNGNDVGTDPEYDIQKVPNYEGAVSNVQSKKKGVRRINFTDTDNNSAEDGDLQMIDYFEATEDYIEEYHPRNSAEGTWGEDDNQEETTTEESVTDETTTDETTTTEITTSGETTTVADIPETTSKQDVTTTAPVKVKAPAKAKIAKVNTKKLAATSAKLSLKKVKGAKGYQVAVYKTKKLANKNKKALVKKFVKKIKVTVKSKKLKNKKTLFVKARAYVLSGSNKVYGKWSKVKKIKIK